MNEKKHLKENNEVIEPNDLYYYDKVIENIYTSKNNHDKVFDNIIIKYGFEFFQKLEKDHRVNTYLKNFTSSYINALELHIRHDISETLRELRNRFLVRYVRNNINLLNSILDKFELKEQHFLFCYMLTQGITIMNYIIGYSFLPEEYRGHIVYEKIFNKYYQLNQSFIKDFNESNKDRIAFINKPSTIKFIVKYNRNIIIENYLEKNNYSILHHSEFFKKVFFCLLEKVFPKVIIDIIYKYILTEKYDYHREGLFHMINYTKYIPSGKIGRPVYRNPRIGMPVYRNPRIGSLR